PAPPELYPISYTTLFRSGIEVMDAVQVRRARLAGVPSAPDEQIRAAAAEQLVAAAATAQDVIAPLAVEHIVAGAAVQIVISSSRIARQIEFAMVLAQVFIELRLGGRCALAQADEGFQGGKSGAVRQCVRAGRIA